MFSTLVWNVWCSPLSLGLGLIPQLWHVWRPSRHSFALAVCGALLVSAGAYVDRDATLFVGQLLVLPLLRLRRAA